MERGFSSHLPSEDRMVEALMRTQSYCLDIRVDNEEARKNLIAFLEKNKEVLGVTGIAEVQQDVKILRVYSGEGWDLAHHIREEYIGGYDFDFTVYMTEEKCHKTLTN